MRTQKFLLVLVFIFSALGSPTLGQQKSKPPEPQEEETPDLNSSTGMWTDTNPQVQVVLGLADLAFMGSVHLLEDKELREVGRRYKLAHNTANKAEVVYNGKKKGVSDQEHILADLTSTKSTSDQQLKFEEEMINTKTTNLTKARSILTTSERVRQLEVKKARMIELHSKAIQGHTGTMDSFESVFDGLSTAERDEALRVRNEYNALREMPDMDQVQKDAYVKQCQAELTTAREARDATLKRVQEVQQRISLTAAEIDKLKPGLQGAELEWGARKGEAEVVRNEMLAIAKQKGLQRLGFKAVSYGVYFVFGIDFVARLGYYVVGQKDPGWFPFLRLVKTFAP